MTEARYYELMLYAKGIGSNTPGYAINKFEAYSSGRTMFEYSDISRVIYPGEVFDVRFAFSTIDDPSDPVYVNGINYQKLSFTAPAAPAPPVEPPAPPAPPEPEDESSLLPVITDPTTYDENMPEVYDLKVTAEKVRKVSLDWNRWGSDGFDGHIVKRYNSKKQLIAIEEVVSEYSISAYKYDAYVPYKGTYYFTVSTYKGNIANPSSLKCGKESNMVQAKSASLAAPTAKITKISDKNAKITIKKATGSTGTYIYQYVSGKWKYIGSTTKTKYSVTKNTAGKRSYKFKSYISENGKKYFSSKYSSSVKPLGNYRSYSFSSNPANYPDYSEFWRLVKIYYSGNKVMLKSKFINTHLYGLKNIKVKVTLYCDGKKVATKYISSGKIKSNSAKTVGAVVMKKKSGYDLRNGGTYVNFRIVSTKW